MADKIDKHAVMREPLVSDSTDLRIVRRIVNITAADIPGELYTYDYVEDCIINLEGLVDIPGVRDELIETASQILQSMSNDEIEFVRALDS